MKGEQSRLRVLLAVVGTLIVGAPTIASGLQQSMPPRINGRGGDAIWLSADAVLDGQGRLKPNIDRPGILADRAEWLRGVLDAAYESTQTEGCHRLARYWPSLIGGPGPPKNGAEIVMRASNIFRGTITGTEGGFYKGRPSLLVRLRVTEWVAGSGPRNVFVPYPFGEFEIGDARLCLLGGGDGEVAPRVGDDWIIFFAGSPRGVAGNVYPIAEHEYFASRGDLLLAPEPIVFLPGLESIQSVEDLMRFAREHLRGSR